MLNRRVMVDFNRRGQPIKDSGGLLGSWLGSLSNDLNIIPINYTDWRKVPKNRNGLESYSGGRCKDLKQHIWMKYRRNTIEKAFEARRGLIPEDQWKEFVEIQFTDKAKDKLSQVMTQNIQDEASKTSTESRPYDAFEQVFGYEPSGRVRCMGRGVTPSKYLLNHESMTSNTEILEMKTRLKGLEEKLDIVTDALLVLVKSKSQFQVTASATTGNKKVKTDLHQSSSINSDQLKIEFELEFQENGILRTGI
ncbi:unnamed protein product [Arabidopsis thaliana]|uniref:(thale cress) hypothetical protein n=1 Tax=Arabidopsis thaliana TaxID=3702 RepID=A0A7G2EQF2_ARATH|nr:unnamed protein product [Arabidopsis thaliana]